MVSYEQANEGSGIMSGEESGLDGLLQAYRTACPDPEPSANFMPGIWHKIEARRSFWFVFQREARALMTASAALFLVLLVLNLFSGSQNHLMASSYADALMAEHTAEATYYTEAIRATPDASDFSDSLRR